MPCRDEHTPDLKARRTPTVADLYALYEREAAEGFPERRTESASNEACWLSEADLTRPDDLASRPEEIGDATAMIERMRSGEQPRAFLIRRHRDGSTDHHQAVADDPNLHRAIDAGWVGD